MKINIKFILELIGFCVLLVMLLIPIIGNLVLLHLFLDAEHNKLNYEMTCLELVGASSVLIGLHALIWL